MNNLSLLKQAQILNLLIEGNSMRATSRIADVSINTVTKLLIDVGRACLVYQDKAILAWSIRIKRFAMFPASAFSTMKSGRSATAKRGT